jgi:hypothetical protein
MDHGNYIKNVIFSVEDYGINLYQLQLSWYILGFIQLVLQPTSLKRVSIQSSHVELQ